MSTIETRNPTTGKILQQYPLMNSEEVQSIIQASEHASLDWRQTSYAQRAACLRQIARVLRQNKSEYAQLITLEMGKPIVDAQKEIEKSAWVCEFYADQGEHFLQPRYVQTDHHTSYTCYQPLGIIFAIMPWNYPFWQVFRCVAPNLMAGNAIILSHAPISTGASLAIETLIKNAGVAEHVFRSLIINHDEASRVIQHNAIKGVTITGSPRAGRSIAAQAGAVLKKIVLELGGNDPYLILKDADLELAANICVKSRLANAGQVCIAAKRIIVEHSIFAKFQQLILKNIQDYRQGDPLDEMTTIGPLARADLRETVQQQVQTNLQQGAKLITGGKIPPGEGFFYPPTLLTDLQENMPAMQEEIFGPVICLFPANNEQHAIELANMSPYGLAAAVFTQDLVRGEKIAAEYIQAGSCFVNNLVSSDPRLPFGGIKESGFGRELSSEGIHEFVNIKTICIDR